MTDYLYLDDGDLQLYHGDVLAVLRELPSGVAQTCVTSPPYWGLRDYGTGTWNGGNPDCDHTGPPKASDKSGLKNDGRPSELVGQNDYERAATIPYRDVCGKCGAQRADQQLGLEPTPTLYVERMVEVFREVRRVLRDDGTLWLNIGDSYHSSTQFNPSPKTVYDEGHLNGHRPSVAGLKPKDLVGIPWRLAFALQADGWYLRSDIIWSKPNPMPESVTDRPTKSHEYVFLFSKQPRYFYDADAVREPHDDKAGGIERFGKIGSAGGYVESERTQLGGVRSTAIASAEKGRVYNPAGRNLRSVWQIATQPFPEAHFATYPEELVRRCILAGTSERGGCAECGAPWRRIAETQIDESRPPARRNIIPPQVTQAGQGTNANGSKTWGHWTKRETTGWKPSCSCLLSGYGTALVRHPPDPIPQLVLDPFIGSGTTALVARKHGRRSIGIDLSTEYLGIAARRTSQLSLLGVEGGG